MDIIEANDPPPVPCLDLPVPPAVRPRADDPLALPLLQERSPLDVLDEALQRPYPRELTREPRAPAGELPDLATRIDEAQRQARARRVQQGLPAQPDDGAYALKRRRKHAPKRGKKHGQFLGTVCDGWEDKPHAR